MKPIVIIVIIFAVIAASSYFIGNYRIISGPEISNTEAIRSICMNYCAQKLTEGINTTAGPCISDQKNWVCDMAHNPRQAVDNLPENQCPAFINGSAEHFVEVDENCNVIRSQ